MGLDSIDGTSTVSDTQASIFAHIRRELDIEDGDRLRWAVEGDGSIRVEIVHQQSRTFADFEGHGGSEVTDVADGGGAWGVESS